MARKDRSVRVSRARNAKSNQLEAFRDRPEGTVLTTDHGVAIPHTDDSLKAGVRGPTILEDFHLREKLTRFDHERIPERVVHARGSGAHGWFQVYEPQTALTRAHFLSDPALRTPVFVRFSTVVGSRGSADTARDVRGFAVKFYTQEGNFDLVGNNMPVFFIQDAAKFPDLVHAVKPEPRNEMPQAASAHDTFWDFVSLVPETVHMVMWVMSDRALPRSYRMMEGFGVHTFRLVDARGRSKLVKFHWKPLLGLHSLVWDEANLLMGRDADFHRRDLWNAIESGNFPEYELGVQVVDEKDELRYGFDMLDPTKLLPEELVPVRRIGKLTLDRNPDNFFAETEQVAFHIGNLVPGVDVTNDPLLQGRLFSYLDTQLSRLGGPNFAEIPINRPIAPVHNHQQDGMARTTIPTAGALYHPNSVGGGSPHLAAPGMGFEHFAERVDGSKIRARSDSFKDHFSQARMFLASQSDYERRHLTDAFCFEVSKVERLEIRMRVVEMFRNVDEALAAEIAARAGVPFERTAPGAKKGSARETIPPPAKSRALSIESYPKDSVKSRCVAVLLADGFKADDVTKIGTALAHEGASYEIVSTRVGKILPEKGEPANATKSFQTAASVFYDAVVVVGGAKSVAALSARGEFLHFVREAFQHAKTVGAIGEGRELLAAARLPFKPSEKGPADASGVVTAPAGDPKAFAAKFIASMKKHRHFERGESPPPL